MEESDEFLENVLKEVEGMKTHVRDLISSLQTNDDLIKVQTPLISILKSEGTPDPKTIGKRSIGRIRISSTQKPDGDKKQFYQSQVPMTQEPEKLSLLTSTFAFEVQDSFLTFQPEAEKWVKGMILINNSLVPQKLPLVVLIPGTGNFTGGINFDFVVNFIPIEYEGKMGSLIKTFRNRLENPIEDVVQFLQSDEKIMLIVTFSYPGALISSRVEGECELILTLISELNEQWSCSVEISIQNALNPILEDKEKIEFVLRGISPVEESFNLSTTMKVHLAKTVQSFLNKFNFEEIESKSTGFDSSFDSYVSQNFGLLFQFEKCSNEPKSINCRVNSRSRSQMKLFACLFLGWAKQEKLKISNLSPKDTSHLNSTLQGEISILLDLVHLNHNGFLGGGKNTGDLTWFDLFVKAVLSTDFMLIQNAFRL